MNSSFRRAWSGSGAHAAAPAATSMPRKPAVPTAASLRLTSVTRCRPAPSPAQLHAAAGPFRSGDDPGRPVDIGVEIALAAHLSEQHGKRVAGDVDPDPAHLPDDHRLGAVGEVDAPEVVGTAGRTRESAGRRGCAAAGTGAAVRHAANGSESTRAQARDARARRTGDGRDGRCMVAPITARAPRPCQPASAARPAAPAPLTGGRRARTATHRGPGREGSGTHRSRSGRSSG